MPVTLVQLAADVEKLKAQIEQLAAMVPTVVELDALQATVEQRGNAETLLTLRQWAARTRTIQPQ